MTLLTAHQEGQKRAALHSS